jgi:arginase
MTANRFIITPFFLDAASPELEMLSQPNWAINKPVMPDGEKQQRMSAIHEPLAGLVAEAVKRGERPVSIAGDCCTTIGVLAGLQSAGLQPTLLWLDAHSDFNTWETTPSGFLGGMPLAMLVGRGEQTMPRAVGLRPFPERRVILTDGRDLDPGEKLAIEDSEVVHIRDTGALLEHPLLNDPLYVHFDADIINPDDAPAMRYATPGGPSAAELKALFGALAQSDRIVAVSMTTWTPDLDADGRSRAVCMELLDSLIQ